MNIGDYIRLNKNNAERVGIDRIRRIDKHEKYNVYYFEKYNGCVSNPEYMVIKSSPNIIDLIEVGDYVNGMKITNIWKNDETEDIEIEFNKKDSYLYVKNWNYESRIEEYKIKSIVTKEQFESMEYKL